MGDGSENVFGTLYPYAMQYKIFVPNNVCFIGTRKYTMEEESFIIAIGQSTSYDTFSGDF